MANEDVVYFDTEDGAALFDGAATKGHFWTICRYFVSEKFLTYCGIASSVTVLNSLGVEAPEEPQIFPYRMFTARQHLYGRSASPSKTVGGGEGAGTRSNSWQPSSTHFTFK